MSRLRSNRVLVRSVGLTAALAVVIVALTDFNTSWWDEHAMLTSIVADVLVVVLGLVVIDELLQARHRRRWERVAFYAFLDIGASAREVWLALAIELDLGDDQATTTDGLRERVVSEAGRETLLARALALAADAQRRRALSPLVASLSERGHQVLTEWAPVMIATSAYSSELNRYVDLQARLVRLERVLSDEAAGRPVALPEYHADPDWIGRRIASCTLVAIALDLEFHERAYAIVPRDRLSDEDQRVEVTA